MLLYCNPRRGDRPPAFGVEASLSGDVLLVGFLVGVSLVGGDSGLPSDSLSLLTSCSRRRLSTLGSIVDREEWIL